jgi:RNA polymerase sigma factor (sigma-70 family)
MPPTVDDALAKVIKGDLAAYEQVVEEYQCSVWSVLSVLLYDRETTERILREVFIEIFEGLERFDPKQHRFKDLVRATARRRVRKELQAQHDKGDAPLQAYREHITPHFEDDQLAWRYQHALIDRFRRCSGKLPDSIGKMWQMRYHHSRDLQSISKATKRPVTSVRQQMNRALSAMAACMNRAGDS